MGHETVYPHTMRSWLISIKDNGPSKRPFPTDNSDLINPESYPDPLEIKSERAALASIFAVRGYQRAKKRLLALESSLSSPPSKSIHYPVPLLDKSDAIGAAFAGAMADELLADENFVLSLPPDDKRRSVYDRLESILQPHKERAPFNESITVFGSERVIENQSVVFTDVYGGVEALPGQIGLLLQRTAQGYVDRFGYVPDTLDLLRIMKNSYHSYIKHTASDHKADARVLRALDDMLIAREKYMGITELIGDSLETLAMRIRPEIDEIVRDIQRKKKGNISRKTTCPFLISSKYLLPFLDETPDFDVALEDAFNLHMRLLAA